MKVFISHSSLDKPIARRVAEPYRSRGVDIWIEEGELGPGDSLADRLTTTISEIDAFVLVLTRAYFINRFGLMADTYG
jgi:hypothetical protein